MGLPLSSEESADCPATGQNIPVRKVGRSKYTTTVEFQGRLGNLFFVYAAGLTVQKFRGGTLHLLDWRTPSAPEFIAYLDPTGVGGLPQSFRGFRFFARRRLIDKVLHRIIRGLRELLRWLCVLARQLQIVEQRSAFSPIVDDIECLDSRNLLLLGYFQHPTWFEPSLDVVTEKIWVGLSQHVARLFDADATVISVRRGDYVRLGWDILPSYYERAIDALGPIEGPIWITSDDPVAAKAMLEPLLRDRNLEAVPLPNLDTSPSMRDFALLCVARNVIMSNSTFCWWGTVTGQLHGGQSPKKVVCPSPWLATYPDSDVLIRPDRTLIEATFGAQVD